MFVDRHIGGDRRGALHRAHGGSAALGDARPTPRADARQQCSAVGGALGGVDGHQFGIHDIGEDLPPERALAPPPATRTCVTGPAPRISSDAVAQTESHPFEHRAPLTLRRLLWRTVSPTNAPRASGIGVRRTLAREVGQEEEALAPRSTAPAGATTLSNETPGANVSR